MAEPHDPGGKVRLPMLPGVDGWARVSDDGRFRHSLCRDWSLRRFTDGRAHYALWIGMNPSTADAEVDDPTIRREIEFTKRIAAEQMLPVECYWKCNVMDFRATSPKDLVRPGVTPCSDENIVAIRGLADRAAIIVACWGKVHKSLRCYPDRILSELRGRPLWCLGKNADGSPRHPLYLAGDTPLERFR